MKQTLNKLLFVFALIFIGNLIPIIANADTAYVSPGVYAIMNIGPNAGTDADPFYPGQSITVGGGADCSGICTYFILGAQLSATPLSYFDLVASGVPSSSLLATAASTSIDGSSSGGGSGGNLPYGFTTLVYVGNSGMSYPYGSTSFTVPYSEGTYFINFVDGHSFKYSIPFVDKIVPCATDTSTCPGGSTVGRENPPLCNFAACPNLSNWVTVTANPSTISYGGGSTITWQAAPGATYCSVVSPDQFSGSGGNSSQGSFYASSLKANTSFNVSCVWPTSYCSGTVAGSHTSDGYTVGPYEGQNCAQFSSLELCYQGWLTHGCSWGGSTSSYYVTCFTSDTLVDMADGTKKNIQDVKLGDVLKGEKTNNQVIGFHQPKLGSKLLYSFNGGRYFVTAEHPFKTIDGWKSINPKLTEQENIGITVTPLKVGDTLITDKGNILLKTIDSKNDASDTQLYNFLLNGDHTYYADGYLVHNKAQCIIGQGLYGLETAHYCFGDSPDYGHEKEFCIGAGGLPTNSGTCPLNCSPNGTIYGDCGGGYTMACIGGYKMCVLNNDKLSN